MPGMIWVAAIVQCILGNFIDSAILFAIRQRDHRLVSDGIKDVQRMNA